MRSLDSAKFQISLVSKFLLLTVLLNFQNVFAQVPDTDKMLPKIEAEKDDSARARLVWHCLGTSETDPVYDLRIAEKLLVHSRKRKDKVEEVFALSCLGYDYRLFGDKSKSWKYALQAMSVAEKTTSKESKAIAHNVLALNYEDIANYPKAVTLFSKTVKYNAEAKFDELQCVAFLSLAELYLNTNKPDQALTYAQRGYELSLRIGYRDYLGPLLQMLGAIHEKLGNDALAVTYYNLAVKEGYRLRSPRFINSSYTALAQFYYGKTQRDSATAYAKTAIAATKNTAFSNMAIYPAKLLLDIYRNKNIDSAFKYSEIYRAANDSLFNSKTLQQTQLLAFNEDLRQRELSEEKVKAEERRSENIQYILIAFGIITLLTLYLLLSRSFITSPKMIEFFGAIALLIVFEFLNLLLHPFLETLTHHNLILMLVGLVCIAALLVPMHHKIEKWATSKLVEKNKKIRLESARKMIERLGPE